MTMSSNNPLTKDNPARNERDCTIAQDRLKGMTYSQIAEKHGVVKSTVGNILRDDDIKAILEQGTKELIAFIPKAVDNYNHLLTSGTEKIQLEASRDILKTTGIMPSHTSTQFFTNIYNQTNTISMLDPRIMGVIGSALGGLLDSDDVIEVVPDE